MENICDVMSGVLFSQLLFCVVSLALMLFSLNQSGKISFTLFLKLYVLVIYLTICYIYCRLSKNITEKSYEIGDVAYNSLWYEVLVKEQKMIILTICQSQRKFQLTGLGIVDCSLETFLRVIYTFI